MSIRIRPFLLVLAALVVPVAGCMPRRAPPPVVLAEPTPPVVLEATPKLTSIGGDLGTIGVGTVERGGALPSLDETNDVPVVITGTSTPPSRNGSAWDGPVAPRR